MMTKIICLELVDWHFPSSPVTFPARTATACNAKPACRRQCLEFVPGEKYGRDPEPSCLTCTHSRATHQQPDPKKRKARR